MSTSLAGGCPASWLTDGQVQVLRLLAGGMSSKQAAAALGKAVGTVELHLHCARRRTGCATTNHLIAEAGRRGLI